MSVSNCLETRVDRTRPSKAVDRILVEIRRTAADGTALGSRQFDTSSPTLTTKALTLERQCKPFLMKELGPQTEN